MLSSPFESLIRNTGAPLLTDIFIGILMVLFVLSVIWKMSDKHHAFTNYAPTLLTSVGILGTFAGIIAGLLDFDPTDIDGSIGVLLSGLKVAFITSLIGMALSIVFKALVSSGMLVKQKSDFIDEDELGIGDLYNVMREQAAGIDSLKRVISENDESSLVGQIKLMRSDLTDHYKVQSKQLNESNDYLGKVHKSIETQQVVFSEFSETLWSKLHDFAEMLSKSATEQVVTALKDVISDFNKNLIEQFGDNFKELNAAVEKLVTWQDNYKEQLSEMKEQYELSVLAISKTEASVSNISEEAKVIPVSMGELKTVMQVNQHQINELGRHLDAFKDIRDRAVEAVPEIRSQIDITLDGVKTATEVLSAGMSESVDKVKTVIMSSAEDFENNVTRTNAALQEASNTLANSSEGIKDQLDTALTDINNHVRNMVSELSESGKHVNEDFKAAGEQLLKQSNLVLGGLESTISSVLSDTGESVTKQVHMLDDAMAKEIEQAMNQLGNALGRITGQFTLDYKGLVSEMKRVVAGSGNARL